MARINTNVSAIIAQHNLQKSQNDLSVSLQRLSTGLRINSGKDDPAGLITSERLRSEINGINAAISNAERATDVLGTADAALSQVSDLLTSIKGLAIQSANTAGLSKDEIQANQLQIDSAVDSITRIANSTSFGTLKLLNGSLDYVTSGVSLSAISDARIYSANFGTAGTALPITTQVLASAQKAGLFVSAAGAAAIPSAVTLEVAGAKGVDVIQFASGTKLSAIAFAVNQVSDSTGVVASVVSGAAAGLSALDFQSTDFGSSQFVSVNKIPGSGGDFFQTYDALGAGANAVNRKSGQDVVALVNGNLATGDGTKVSLNTAALKVDLQLTDAFAQSTGVSKTFTVTGGGATFQLGPSVESSQQVSFGIQSVNASQLGNSVVGFLNSIVSGGANSLTAGNADNASQIIDEAINQVSTYRGRLGSFETNTLQTNIDSLQTSLENLTSSESRIRDADFASETSNLSRAQVLTSVGTSVLSVANSSSQSVLKLLQ